MPLKRSTTARSQGATTCPDPVSPPSTHQQRPHRHPHSHTPPDTCEWQRIPYQHLYTPPTPPEPQTTPPVNPPHPLPLQAVSTLGVRTLRGISDPTRTTHEVTKHTPTTKRLTIESLATEGPPTPLNTTADHTSANHRHRYPAVFITGRDLPGQKKTPCPATPHPQQRNAGCLPGSGPWPTLQSLRK